MSIEKIVGLETEYGIVFEGRQGASLDESSSLLIKAYLEKDGLIKNSMINSRLQFYDQMLPNGARFYVDHGHPEYSTPECCTALDLIACDKAGEMILCQSAQKVNQELPNGHRILLFKNNSDKKGHSYGCHENYLIEAKTFETILQPKSEKLHRYLIPFLVTRQIYAGAGKVGSENNTSPVQYQISQRADFFETVIGLQTTYQRPIINTRDEPHADAKRFRRLHVILGDANMCEIATLLKVGTTQIILKMLEDEAELPDMKLADPVQAIHDISHDTELQGNVKLENGQFISPIDIQREFWIAAIKYMRDKPETDYEQKIINEWDFVLHKMPENMEQLVGKIDWITKWYLIESFMQKEGESWDSPFVTEIDIKYHSINPQESHFYLLQEAGVVEKCISENTIKNFVNHPPTDTRAYLRGECIRLFGNEINEVDWSRICVGLYVFYLADPRAFGQREMDSILKSSRDQLFYLAEYFSRL